MNPENYIKYRESIRLIEFIKHLAKKYPEVSPEINNFLQITHEEYDRELNLLKEEEEK